MESVSVIIPTFKRANYIERAIESVLKQSYKNIEVIVVDDNGDNTEDRKNVEKIMKKYINDNRVKYLKHKENKNGAAARNTGLNIAKGDYITFLDDDDVFLKDRITKLVKLAKKKRNSFDLFYTGVVVVENEKIKKISLANKEGNFIEEILCQTPIVITGSNLFFTQKSIKSIAGFDESFFRHQDLEMLVRFFDHGYKATYIEQPYVIKINNDRSNVPNIDNIIKIRKKYLDTFQEKIKKLDKKKIYNSNYYKVLVCALRVKCFEKLKLIKHNFAKYNVKLSIKEYMYLFIELLNLYFPILNVFRYFCNIKNRIRTKKNILNEVKYILNENSEKNY